jgi:RNA polymerase subunit RPABC4/transcription elongation factor Spt4
MRSKCLVVTQTETICPNCVLDPTTQASSGKYKTGGPTPFTSKICPVCAGRGRLVNDASLQIQANVKWGAKSPEPDVPEPEGFVPIGFVRIKAEMKYYDLIYNAHHFVIDGIRCSHFDRQLKRRGLLSYVICECLVKVDK